MFADAGFVRTLPASREEVYDRAHHKDPRYVVRVYSSIPADGSAVRGRGKDAIRVVALLITPHKVYPIAKMPRVFRTATAEGEEGEKQIVERLRTRMREAYAVVNARLRNRDVLTEIRKVS